MQIEATSSGNVHLWVNMDLSALQNNTAWHGKKETRMQRDKQSE